MRLAAVAVATATALGLPASAAAKEPIELRICGAAQACRDLRWAPAAERESAPLVPALLEATASPTSASPPALAPFYRAELRAERRRVPLELVPAAGAVRRDGGWSVLEGGAGRALDEATRGLEPYPRPRVLAATVNGLPSASPSVYAEVFAPAAHVAAPPADAARARIRLDLSRSPWSDDAHALWYVPATDSLRRGHEWVQASPELAAGIESDLAAVGRDAGGAPLVPLATGLGLGVALLLVAWRTIGSRRSHSSRRRARAPQPRRAPASSRCAPGRARCRPCTPRRRGRAR